MRLLLALAFIKQKSADQLHIDNKNKSTCNLSTLSLEKIKLNFLGLYQQQLGKPLCGQRGNLASQRHARRSSVCRHYCKDQKGCPDLAVHPALPLCQAPTAVKAACKSLGHGHCSGRAGWIKEKATVCHRDPKGTCFGDQKLPDVLGVTTFSLFHYFFHIRSRLAVRIFKRFSRCSDELQELQGREHSCQAQLPAVNWLEAPNAAIAASLSVCSITPAIQPFANIVFALGKKKINPD